MNYVWRTGISPQPSCHNRTPSNPVMVQVCLCPLGMFLYEEGGECVLQEDCQKCSGSVSGHLHFLTYDGLRYVLFDQCSHILTKDCVDNTFTLYSITSDRWARDRNQTCIDEAMIVVSHLNMTVNLYGSPARYTINGAIPDSSELYIDNGTGCHNKLWNLLPESLNSS